MQRFQSCIHASNLCVYYPFQVTARLVTVPEGLWERDRCTHILGSRLLEPTSKVNDGLRNNNELLRGCSSGSVDVGIEASIV